MKMSKKLDIEIHRIDDWEAIYVNGECDYQHHHVLEEFLEYLEKPAIINSFSIIYHDEDDSPSIFEYVLRKGCFPDTLDELYKLC